MLYQKYIEEWLRFSDGIEVGFEVLLRCYEVSWRGSAVFYRSFELSERGIMAVEGVWRHSRNYWGETWSIFNGLWKILKGFKGAMLVDISTCMH